MKTVAFYVSSLAKGGAERVLLMIADSIKKTDHVIIITDHRDLVEYDLPSGTERVVLSESISKSSSNRFFNLILRIKSLRMQCKKTRPDVVIAFMENAIPRMIVASLGLHIPIIGAIRGNPKVLFRGRIKRALVNILFIKLRYLVFQTEQQKEIFHGIILKKSIIIPNPINPTFCREKYSGLKRNQIVSVGALAPRKNQKMLIEAFSLIAERYSDFKLVIYGEGQLRKELEELILKHGLVDRVELAGEIEDIYTAIKDVKLFVMTSVDEGIPNALMEAMAIGLPVISTDCPCGGPAYLIQNEENGLLIPMNNIAIAADAMSRILDNPQLGEKLGENATKVQQTFETTRVCEQWRVCIDEA